MKHKLILVEGLPGSGKTTTAKLVQKILREKGIPSKLFLEGDLDHPADFESVAWLSEAEFNALGISDESHIRKAEGGYLVSYRKLGLELGANDIYELPYAKNQDLIVENWGRFAASEDGAYIFECCFIQNPVTVGMIKYGVSYEQVVDYVKALEKQVSSLNPLLIYIDLEDVEGTFLKAVEERPKEWSQFFTEYYTAQGYGRAHELEGISGTVEVLQARKRLERKIIDALDIPKVVINRLTEVEDLLKEALV